MSLYLRRFRFGGSEVRGQKAREYKLREHVENTRFLVCILTRISVLYLSYLNVVFGLWPGAMHGMIF